MCIHDIYKIKNGMIINKDKILKTRLQSYFFGSKLNKIGKN